MTTSMRRGCLRTWRAFKYHIERAMQVITTGSHKIRRHKHVFGERLQLEYTISTELEKPDGILLPKLTSTKRAAYKNLPKEHPVRQNLKVYLDRYIIKTDGDNFSPKKHHVYKRQVTPRLRATAPSPSPVPSGILETSEELKVDHSELEAGIGNFYASDEGPSQPPLHRNIPEAITRGSVIFSQQDDHLQMKKRVAILKPH
ncbi:hypothetical protein JB92DRAFT_2836383 [Gautieria morchelliformis]|nr:hypothetical protein JB92DRAFT_2836383 [Gautieria morchelliformis]